MDSKLEKYYEDGIDYLVTTPDGLEQLSSKQYKLAQEIRKFPLAKCISAMQQININLIVHYNQLPLCFKVHFADKLLAYLRDEDV